MVSRCGSACCSPALLTRALRVTSSHRKLHGINRDSRSRRFGRSNAEHLTFAINSLQGSMTKHAAGSRAMFWVSKECRRRHLFRASSSASVTLSYALTHIPHCVAGCFLLESSFLPSCMYIRMQADALNPWHNGGRPDYQQTNGGIAGPTYTASTAALWDEQIIHIPWWYGGYEDSPVVNCSAPNIAKGCPIQCDNVKCAMDNTVRCLHHPHILLLFSTVQWSALVPHLSYHRTHFSYHISRTPLSHASLSQLRDPLSACMMRRVHSCGWLHPIRIAWRWAFISRRNDCGAGTRRPPFTTV